jgi:hypothetical protein
MKGYKYLSVEENHNTEHKKHKERLKEYIRRLRSSLNKEQSAKIKCKKKLDHWQYQY